MILHRPNGETAQFGLDFPSTGRKHIYRDPVFGCILFNTSDSSLEFHALDRAGEGRPVARYVVPEEAGLRAGPGEGLDGDLGCI